MPDVAELGRKVKAKYPGQYDDLSDGDVGRKVKIKYAGAYDDFTDAPSTVLPTERQEFGRRPLTLDESLSRSARVNRGRPQAKPQTFLESQGLNKNPGRPTTAFESKPILEQWKERVGDAAARGGGSVSRMARQAAGFAMGGPYAPPMDFPEWREAEEGRMRNLEERRQNRPSSFGTDIVEGAIESVPTAALATLGGIATGGSLPAMAALGGGLAAASADWSEPERAAAQTAIGATAPIIGGKLGQAVAGKVAGRLTAPITQAAARIGGEVGGGGAGDVLGSGTEQLAFEGKISPRELAKQGIIGSALNVPGGGKKPAVDTPSPRRRAIISPPSTQEFVPETFGYIPRRKLLPPARGEEIIPTEPLPSRAVREVISQPDPRFAPPAPVTRRFVYPDAPETQEIPVVSMPLLKTVNNPEGGIPSRSERLSGRFGALARQQEAAREAAPQARRKDTGVLSPVEYLKRKTGGDGIRVSDRGEAALLGAKEAGIIGLTNRNSKWRLSDAQVMLDEGGFMLEDGRKFTDPSVTENDVLTFLGASGKQGRRGTKGIDRSLADEEAAYYARLEEEQAAGPTVPPQRKPTPPPAPRRPGGRVGTPEPRRISETGALGDIGDFFGQMKAKEARLPRATDENIQALRSRQEELGRLAYDRRGDFTGDLRDEYNRLNSIIREYDNARSPRELAPPNAGPERFTPPPEERAARREALQPKTGPMPETLTPGRRVSQEFQVPGGLKAKDSFSSREDARQGHFEQFDDQELVQEIRRMEDVQNQAVRGQSKLSRQELEANRFDLKVAIDMQKERGRQQRAIGIDPANQIEPRTPSRPARKIQHSQFGAVTEAADQAGVPKGKLKVIGEDGVEHTIQNPRTKGNREATFVRSIPSEALPELREPGAPQAPRVGRERAPSAIDYTIPDEAMPELRRPRGQIMGSGFGALQGLFERGGKAKPPKPGQQALFETAPKKSLGKQLASGGVSALTLPRALMASADLSAPLRQGAILTLPPSQWGRAAKSGVRMIQAAIPDIKVGGKQIVKSRYEGLVNELNSHPDAKVGKDAGLDMVTDPTKEGSFQGREEDFISKWAGKIPIVKQSEQAFKIYSDSIRLETFRKYKRVIDGDKNLSLEQKNAAYKAAADWINIASGRGSFGKTLDKAMPALSTVFFAPRYTASRMQVLNPATYLKNASTPGGRAVLKQQMGDMVQFAGMVSATLALAKAAGAEVSDDPEDADFLKIKIGNVRYDNLAGLQQLMRLYYRTGKDVGRAAVGQKSEQGEGALEIAGKFIRSKLAPVPSFFTDFLSRKDFTGRDFDAKRGVVERVTPLMWKDFQEAYEREGLGGAAMMAPGLLGVGVQDYAKKPGVLSQKNEVYTGELKRLGVTPSESATRLKDEPEDLFKGRAEKIGAWRDQYGVQLIQHPMYQRLSDEQKKAAIESLHGRISEQANEKRPNLRAFNPAAIARGVREGERSRRRTDRDKIYVTPR